MMFGAIGELAIGELSQVSYSVQCAAGALTLTGQNATLFHYVPNVGRMAAIGELAIGEFADIPAAGQYSLGAGVAAFTLTGQDTVLARSHVATFEAGSYVITGQDSTYDISFGVGGETGSFTLAGQDTSLLAVRKIYPSPDATPDRIAYTLFAALGEVAIGETKTTLASAQTTYVLSGQNTVLRQGFNMQAGAGSLVITGQQPALELVRNLVSEAGAYVITGQTAALPVTMPGDAGAFVLTGQAIEFARRRRRMRGNPRVGNPVRGLTRNGNPISARAA